MTIGELIRKYRCKRGLSQEQFGLKMRKRQNYISAWEHGRKHPNAANLLEISVRLKIPMNELVAATKKEK